MVVIPTTAPLRLPVDLENCLDVYAQGDVDCVITVTDAHRNPYFNMVKTEPDGRVSLVIPPPDGVVRRQDAPPVHDMTTVAYVADPRFVMEQSSLFDGRVRAVWVPPERAIDIDTPLDFAWAEWLMNLRRGTV
ncbi:MAG: hypothetical protein VKK63_11770 [Synechococcus sp.]|nr:hypothetical protein [Synechococcus sp.]